MLDPRLAGTALALLSATSFGVMPVLTKVVYEDGADPVGVLAVRFTLAGAVLLGLARLAGQPLPRGRRLGLLAALGAGGYAVQSLCYFLALERISAGLTALLLYAHPAMVVALVGVLTRTLPRPVSLLCVGGASVGTLLTIGPVDGGRTTGILLGLAAAVVYTFYITIGGRITSGSSDHLATSATVLLAAAAVYLGLFAATRPALPSSAAAWSALVAVALVGTVVAVATFFAALSRLGPADTAVVSTFEPVVSVAVAAVALGERLGPLQLLGGALVLTCVVVLARTSSAPTSADAEVPA